MSDCSSHLASLFKSQVHLHFIQSLLFQVKMWVKHPLRASSYPRRSSPWAEPQGLPWILCRMGKQQQYQRAGNGHAGDVSLTGANSLREFSGTHRARARLSAVWGGERLANNEPV